MSDKCHRCEQTVYAAENPVKIYGLCFHPGHFTCKATGAKLTMKTAVNVDGEVYKEGKQPESKPLGNAMSIGDEHVKKVQTHAQIKFANDSAGKPTQGASLLDSHVSKVQTHEQKKFGSVDDGSAPAPTEEAPTEETPAAE